jgi:hypothetical protein
MTAAAPASANTRRRRVVARSALFIIVRPFISAGQNSCSAMACGEWHLSCVDVDRSRYAFEYFLLPEIISCRQWNVALRCEWAAALARLARLSCWVRDGAL